MSSRTWGFERRSDPDDRRVRAVYLTDDGRKTLDKVMQVSAQHEAQLWAGLEESDRERLIALLSQIVTEQGLVPGVHPGLPAAGAQKA